ncbi:winged helix-turn-helix domain-containing protein [Thalassomonas haliotis]|uniref:Winged helix-turn-helix transcriptional regulator n=1 Tax=Thalassomonas haliotis TaxID=485448 RepID=A0ABY7VIH1_9GAMM|nr:winged helix-turn-helix domain-containing protein [Thalassomonas haliotis]WDE13323.1 winged helix-turn-helix transcriptional regulator [Thalassomonas haliotis]
MDKSKLIKLNQWTLDPVNNTLIDPDNNKTIIEAKYAVLLEYLAKNADTLVTREQLIQDVWQDRHVEYRTVNSAISRLRKILGGERDDFIKTHPKLGYSLNCRVEFLGKTAPTKKKRATGLKTAKYALYSLIICFVFLSTFWLWFNSFEQEKVPLNQTPPPILTEKDVPVEPLTYMNGWEMAPNLSHEKSLLAYSYQRNRKLLSQLIIKNLKSKKTVVVEPNAETVSPFWSPKSNELFYKSLSKNKCYIKKVHVHPKLKLTAPEIVTSCGQKPDYSDDSGIAISTDEKWLYYIFSHEKASLRVIKRFNLKSRETETLTAPIMNSAGEVELTLHPDNNQLAFMRQHDDFSLEIMILNLTSGELNSVIKRPYLPIALTWSKFSDYLIYIGEDVNTLNAVNINTGNIIPLYQYSKQILAPHMINETEFLLSFGDIHSSNIKQVDLKESSLSSSTLIESSFKDHSAALYKSNGLEIIAFVSNRSGNYQIWLQENEQLQQLTQFEEKPYIENMAFSANGENLLFLKDRKLHVLNMSSKIITSLTHPTNQVKNFIWQCSSDENVLVVAKEKGIWGLYEVNIFTQNSKLLTTNLTSIHGLCDSVGTGQGNYFATTITEKGIFKLTKNLSINKSKQYLTDISDTDFSDNQRWAITKSALYYINGDSNIFEYDFASEQHKKLNFPDIDTYRISIQNNKLILNNLKVSDTFIGKITITDLSERLTANSISQSYKVIDD